MAWSSEVPLLRQWFSAALTEHSYLSLRTQAEDGCSSVKIFQVLSLERRNIVVRGLPEELGDIEMEGLYTISAQPFEI